MYQRERVKQAWEDAGLYRSRNRTVRAFLQHVDRQPEECWPELAERLRTDFPGIIQEIALPIWKTGDKLLRLNLIRMVDPERREEEELAVRVVKAMDPQTDEPELRAILHTASPPVLDQVARQKELPPALKSLMEFRRAQLEG
jgi:hypothetical protein